MNLKPYIKVARPDHWVKNVFVLPGAVMAALLLKVPVSAFWRDLLVGLAGTCLVASANYVINEWLDARYDQFHPVKRARPAVSVGLKRWAVYVEYALLAITGLALAWSVNRAFAATAAALLGMGLLYNVEPVRTKDRAILDVLSESVNNALRLMLGWFAVATWPPPPSSLVISYWMGGAFLMAVKRFGEYRLIGDPAVAGQYRRSFRFYTEERLLITAFFYAMLCALLLGVFLVKYRIELLLSLPFVAFLFAWYFHLAFKPDSPVQYPERLHRERGFILYAIVVVLIFVALLALDLTPLHWFLTNALMDTPGAPAP